MLDELDPPWASVYRLWRLNERQYGALTGRRKADALAEAGAERFCSWRRSLHGVPPPCRRPRTWPTCSTGRRRARGRGGGTRGTGTTNGACGAHRPAPAAARATG